MSRESRRQKRYQRWERKYSSPEQLAKDERRAERFREEHRPTRSWLVGIVLAVFVAWALCANGWLGC